MALLIREGDVMSLLDMPNTVSALEQAFLALSQGKAVNRPRTRISQANGVLHVLAATYPGLGVLGLKTYTVFREGVRFVVLLFSGQDGRLLALIESDWLGRMRTGGTSALATKYLAREDASVVGLIGSGKQAVTQLLGVCAVRPVRTVYVYSRRLPECETFCNQMAHRLNIEVTPATSPRHAIEEADIVITATTSSEPVFPGDWLKPGCHINAIGSNWAKRREIDVTTLQHCSLITTDSVEQANAEAGDFIIPVNEGNFDWDRVWELSDVVARDGPQRETAYDITLYKGLGIALEDIAVAARVYTLARERDLGEEIDLLG